MSPTSENCIRDVNQRHVVQTKAPACCFDGCPGPGRLAPAPCDCPCSQSGLAVSQHRALHHSRTAGALHDPGPPPSEAAPAVQVTHWHDAPFPAAHATSFCHFPTLFDDVSLHRLWHTSHAELDIHSCGVQASSGESGPTQRQTHAVACTQW